LEETVELGSWLVGSTDAIRNQLVALREELGFEYLTIFPHLPGMTQVDTLEQLRRFHTEIMPALAEPAPAGTAVMVAS
jgi:hypothetical protein